MSFFKSVLNVLNPLPSIIKANKTEGNLLQKVLNVVNPAGALIKDNSGLSDLKLSPEYQALQSGGSVLTETEKQNAAAAKAEFDEKQQKDSTNVYLILGAAAVGAIFLFSKK